jgi:hypothetical protein
MFSKSIRKGINLPKETAVKQLPEKPDCDGYCASQTDIDAISARKVVVTTNIYTAAILHK